MSNINFEEKCKLLEDQVKILEDAQNRTVKQYELMVDRYDNIVYLTRKYYEHMEYCLQMLEEENKRLKEQSNCYGID